MGRHDAPKRPRRHRSPRADRQPTDQLRPFSFLQHKSELERVLLGHAHREQLVQDTDDFWLFMQKYEALLERSGNCVPPAVESELDRLPRGFPTSFQNIHLVNVRFAEPVDKLLSRAVHCRLSSGQRIQFLQVVLQYLDFRQKEKFGKLKKLRQAQSRLPVAKYQREIISAVKSERVVLLAGDTGCGKSTQIPQYLQRAGFNSIACTQPRRIACISLSKRVAHELLCEYGTKVGYQIRFEKSKSKDTNIVFITEGLLLRQLSQEAMLAQYDVLVLDEIHERHLHGDFLLGVAKCLIKVRPELKLVLMSATINLQLFSNYFAQEEACVIEVPGRLFPIRVHYMPPFKDVAQASDSRPGRSERLSPEPYVQIMQLIDQKYPPSERGDLLIFMSGLNEITTVVEAAWDYAATKQGWIILPLHSSLSVADQDLVFDYAPAGVRKCIVSTNIAETSVTIDGVRFVVDSGKLKEMSYDPSCKLSRLKEFQVSRASAEQRKGRAGRTGPGVCYRLYTEKAFEELEPYAVAEIHRVPLENLLLQMVQMGLPNPRLFPFLEPPSADSIENSILSLKQQGALTVDEKLTAVGRALSRLPVDLALGKMLLMGCVFRQLHSVLTLAAALSVQSPFTNRAYRDKECEIARRELESNHGDPIILLNAYREWLDLKQVGIEHGPGAVESTQTWCRRRGLEEQRFYEITKLRNQFQDLLADCGLLEAEQTTKMTSAERAIRHGEVRQLRQLKRAHDLEGPRKRNVLKQYAVFEAGGSEGTGRDIRDVEFRLSHDPLAVQRLVKGASAFSFREFMTLKLILVSGLYPRVAIADEFNYGKSPSQHFFHTNSKPFTSLHPMGYFGNNAHTLQLQEPDIADRPAHYQSKLPLSAKHQLLCYQSLLETTKPYLMNTMRVPAAQTLLLFAHSIDTNGTCSKVVCDSWLCLEFPYPEAGLLHLQTACRLRRHWSRLLNQRLDALAKPDGGVNIESGPRERGDEVSSAAMELWEQLASYMKIEVYYTVKRLLPAELKDIYVANEAQWDEVEAFSSNPFATDFDCHRNLVKGGWWCTEHVTFGCVRETDWSTAMQNQFVSSGFTCTSCEITFHVTVLEKMQHMQGCQVEKGHLTTSDSPDDKGESETRVKSVSSAKTPEANASTSHHYECSNCRQNFNFSTAVDKLRHRRHCKG